MRAGRAFAFGALLSFAAAAPLAIDTSVKALEERDSSCASVYVIVARGSYEPVGMGSMGSAVADKVCAQVCFHCVNKFPSTRTYATVNKISGCNSTGVTYPAIK